MGLPAYSSGVATDELEDAEPTAESLNPSVAKSPIPARVAALKASVNPMTIADLCTNELSAMRQRSLSRSRHLHAGKAIVSNCNPAREECKCSAATKELPSRPTLRAG